MLKPSSANIKLISSPGTKSHLSHLTSMLNLSPRFHILLEPHLLRTFNISLIQLKSSCFYDYAQYDLIETDNTIHTSF